MKINIKKEKAARCLRYKLSGLSLQKSCSGWIVLVALFILCQVVAATYAVTPITNIDITIVGSGPPQYNLNSITIGGYTVTVSELATGTSTGVATVQPAPYDDITNADIFDLNFFAARNSENPPEIQTTMFGGQETWSNSNGDDPDYFIFETGGNDNIEVQAILPGDLLGQKITINSSVWGDTGYVINAPVHNGQRIEGVAFAITDLLDDQGNPLTNSSSIEGIQITAAGVDPCLICAVSSGQVNNPPNVDAGDPQILLWPVINPVQLNGTVTDDDPDQLGQLTILWSQVSGPPGVTFDDDSAEATQAYFPDPGIYGLKLQAWDEIPQEGSDTVTITIKEPVCPVGDFNINCKVTLTDLLIMMSQWLQSDDTINIVGNPFIDMADYTFFSQAWQENWTGSLVVNLDPQQAVNEGAQWKIDNGPWKDSEIPVNDLMPGSHTIAFKTVDNWIEPSSQIVEIVKKQTTTLDETYVEMSGITLLISEFVASNFSTTSDAQGEFDDWIEIYNYGPDPVDIGGMYLTNDLDNPKKWQVQDDVPGVTTIATGGYLLIWADGETDEGPLHASFRLDADNGAIGLFRSDGVTEVDSLEYNRQVTDVSCGRKSESDKLLRYFLVATPYNANSSAYDGMVADTKFSPDRGFYDQDIDVTITCETEGATIRYTLDGSKPTNTHGNIYVPGSPLSIAKGSPGTYDRSTTTLRAFAYKSNWLSTNVDTHTYIFLEDVIRQPLEIPGWPRPYSYLGASKYADHDYEMDPEIVDNPAYSEIIIKALKDIPTLSIIADPVDINMTANGGFYWGEQQKPASVELMYPGEPGKNVQADCRIEPHSHNRLKRSMRLSFKAEYGAGVFSSSLLNDAPLNGKGADQTLDRIVLRGGNNRSWARAWNPGETTYTVDQLYRDKQIEMSGIGIHGAFVHLYINGLYWGLYNPAERPDEWFTSSYMGGEPEDWYTVSHGGSHGGDASRYNYLKGALKDKDMAVPVNYEEMQEYLDIPHYIDYVMLCWYIGMGDWPGGNWWGGNCNNPPGPFKYFCWDGEWSWETTRGHNNGWVHPDFRSNDSGGATIAAIWHSLRVNGDFMMQFADRAYKHLFNDGALTNENHIKSYLVLNDFIRDAVVAESARWGDACEPVGHPVRTRDGTFVDVENEMLGPGFMADNVEKFVGNLRAQGYYPSIDPPVFLINSTEKHGGYVSSGANLTLTSSYEIRYTLDGEDPRLSGGSINPDATLYGGENIPITQTTIVKARAKNGSIWSALHEAVYTLENVAQKLRITELMYHPADGGYNDEDFEFIELQHIGETGENPINLNLVSFTNGIDYTFDDSVDLIPGEYVVVYKNEAAFNTRYPGFTGKKVGPYLGALNNGGEEIDLEDALGTEIHDFDFSDGWYEITDGLGFSLTIRDPSSTDPNDWDRKSGWRASFANGGSPGDDDSIFVLPEDAVIVNELLAHADTLEPNDWVEFYNMTDDPINIGGWFISDNDNDLMKYEIEESFIIPAHGYRVFYADPNFGPGSSDPGSHTGFAFSESGEKVYLTSGSGGEITGVYSTERKFDPSAPDIAFGHYVKSTGGNDFVAMSSNTPGWANDPPKIPSVVINEIAYHPEDPNPNAEFVELYNRSGSPVTLYDSVKGEPWRFVDDPDDPGLAFSFPAPPDTPITLEAGKYLLLVKDLTSFTEVFGAPSGLNLQDTLEWGLGNGSLSNGGEKLELQMPGDLEGTVRMYIRVDRVTYDDVAPWPTAPDGSDIDTLQRKVPGDYGNDVDNWLSASDTAGKVN